MVKKTVSETEFQQARANKDNQGIIRKVCSHYAGILSPEALKACSDMAVWRCLQSHTNGRQKFTTSLYYFIGWECKREVQATKTKYQFMTNVDEPSSYSDPLDKLVVEECLEALTPQEREIVLARYVDNRTLDDIGNEFGYSRQGIKNILTRAMTTMRKVVGIT